MLSCAAALAVGVAACGSSSSDDSSSSKSSSGGGGTPATKGISDTLVIGTTDKVVALDPAGAYDLGSQQLIGNIYQNLMTIPAGGNKPEPDAAQSCEFSDPKTYTCTLKDGLKFSNG